MRRKIQLVDSQEEIQRFAEKLVRQGREGVKWELRKLEWIREERAKLETAEQEESEGTDD